jgi:hypothetical protein
MREYDGITQIGKGRKSLYAGLPFRLVKWTIFKGHVLVQKSRYVARDAPPQGAAGKIKQAARLLLAS